MCNFSNEYRYSIEIDNIDNFLFRCCLGNNGIHCFSLSNVKSIANVENRIEFIEIASICRKRRGGEKQVEQILARPNVQLFEVSAKIVVPLYTRQS